MHVLTAWDGLDMTAQPHLVDQLRGLDLDEFAQLYADRNATYTLPSHDRISPLPNILPDAPDAEAKALGEAALAVAKSPCCWSPAARAPGSASTIRKACTKSGRSQEELVPVSRRESAGPLTATRQAAPVPHHDVGCDA